MRKSPEEISALQAKYPNVPAYAIPTTKTKKSPTNQLTSDIISYVTRLGGYAFRINTQGTYSEKLKKFITSGAEKGVSDILICFDGLLICCELKQGKDKQRPDQEKFQNKIEAAGGKYFITTSFDSFKIQFTNIINSISNG
ncbi:MAG TPA: hypothetical protein VIK89_13900 [Cytophagaceae bacterium]